MRTRLFGAALWLLAAFAATGCTSGPTGVVVTTTPPPPAETLSFISFTPVNGSSFIGNTVAVSFSAMVRSNLAGNITDPAKYTWSVNGVKTVGDSFVDTLAPGTYTVTLTVRGSTTSIVGTSAFTVVAPPPPPSYTGTLASVAADWANPPFTGIKVVMSNIAQTVSDTVDASGGTFTFNSSVAGQLLAGDSVRFYFCGSGAYECRPAYVATKDLGKRTKWGLVPISPTYPVGTYAGQSLALDLRQTCVPTQGQFPDTFYGCSDTTVGGVPAVIYIAGTWKQFPIKLAFAHNPPPSGLGAWEITQEVTADDSVKFWQNAEMLNQQFGFTMFVPAVQSQVIWDGPTGSHFDGVLVRIDSIPMKGTNIFALSGSSGVLPATLDFVTGSIAFRNENLLGASSAVMHEMIHILGPGNGCGWHGIESSGCGPGFSLSLTPTIEDVVYTMLRYEGRNFERATGDDAVVEESIEGERIRLGLPERRVIRR